jgi:hypothetical protein
VGFGTRATLSTCHSRHPDEGTKRICPAGRDVLGPPRLTLDGTAMYDSRRVIAADIWLVMLR